MSTNSGLIDSWMSGPQNTCLSKFKSKDNIEIKLNKIIFGSTYKESGLIWGYPSKQINEDIINKIKPHAETENSFIVNNHIDFENIDRLPLHYSVAFLESAFFDNNGRLSSLVLINFFEEFNPESCLVPIKTCLESLIWKSNADFWTP